MPGRLAPYLMLIAATAFWAGNFVIARAFRDQLPPVSLNFWRWLLALLVLAPLAAGAWPRHAGEVLRHWRLFALLGATGVAGFHTLVYMALSRTAVMNAVLLASTIPVVIVAFSYLTSGERVDARQALGIGLSLLGALVVVARGDPAAIAAARFEPGDLWMAAAVPLWAAYSVLLRRVPPTLPPQVALGAITAAGLAVLSPLFALRVGQGEALEITWPTALAVGYIALFAAVAAFLLWNRGVALVGPNRAGAFIHLMPVFGALLSYLYLAERLEPFHLAGGALVVVGLVVTGRGGRALGQAGGAARRPP